MYISLYVQNVRWCFLLSVCVRCKWLSPTIRRTDSRSSDFFLLLFLPLSPALSVPPHTICAQPSQTFVLYPFYILSSSLSCMHGTQFGGRAEHTHIEEIHRPFIVPNENAKLVWDIACIVWVCCVWERLVQLFVAVLPIQCGRVYLLLFILVFSKC